MRLGLTFRSRFRIKGVAMFRGCQTNRGSKLKRLVYVFCAIFVLSYVLFDVLDVDGSDFPTTRSTANRSICMVEVPRVEVDIYVPDSSDFWILPESQVLPGSDYVLRTQPYFALRQLLPGVARDRGYRVSLPRSSTEDSSVVS
jgi:hypothetical protein